MLDRQLTKSAASDRIKPFLPSLRLNYLAPYSLPSFTLPIHRIPAKSHPQHRPASGATTILSAHINLARLRIATASDPFPSRFWK
jgi:hypothetical protein